MLHRRGRPPPPRSQRRPVLAGRTTTPLTSARRTIPSPEPNPPRDAPPPGPPLAGTAGPLASRLPADADPAAVARTVVALWLECDAALHPVIGHGGAAALFHRSLSLNAVEHPWMAPGTSVLTTSVDLVALEAQVQQRPAAEAAAAGEALFRQLYGLLASLVGDSLTERLLRSVWPPTPNAPAAQDTRA